MGWFEIINLVGTGLFSAVMTMWARKAQDQKDERDFLLKRATENRRAKNDARKYAGGHESEASRDFLVEERRKIFKWDVWSYRKKLVDKGTAVRSTGFHATRRFIAVAVILSVIFLPKILPLFIDNLTVMVGYYENVSSFLPWVSDYEAIKWVAYGSGDNVIMITPMEMNLVYAITGFFFGNQVSKR
jgi:hypothetical protein